MTAPVCLLPDRTAPEQPVGNVLPTIPLATDLRSAIAAVNAMRALLQITTGQTTPQEKGATPGRNGFVTKPPPKKKSAWKEINRTKSRERVYNPTDSSQYVEFEQINTVTMRNEGTGELWTWSR